ncbi:MAG: FGGY-family carbohydrate kinase [Oscillospiraceae bacterium]
MIVLALESSTSSAKAVLYDTSQGVLAVNSCAYPAEICAGGVSDTSAVTALTLETGAAISRGQSVEAVAVCGTWHSIGLCERALTQPGKTYSWDFLPPSGQCAQLRRDPVITDELYSRTGCMPHMTYPRHALRYLASQGLDLRRMQLISQGAYTFYRLTGEYRESISTVSGSGLLNIHTLQYDAFVLDWLGLKPEQLAPLATYRDVSPLTEEAAGRLGIAPGIPVVPAFPDGALNQFAAGSGTMGNMTLSIGTSAAIRMYTTAPKLPENHALWCYYGVDSWMSGAATAGAGNCVNWFMERVLGRTLRFSDLESQLWQMEDIPVFLPFLFGERCPGWNDARRGGFFEVQPEHGAAELYRGLLAGILCNLYQCYEAVCALSGAPEQIHVSGGILNSPGWTQMLANLFRHDLICANEPNMSTIGAAMLAARAAGEATAHLQSSAGQTYRVCPQPEQFAPHEAVYQRYLRAYQAAI